MYRCILRVDDYHLRQDASPDNIFFLLLKGFSSSQGATTTLNLGKDSALNFWQLFGESLSMNLARIVIDVFSIKKSDRMMLFSGCFQSRWHHRTLIVIENGSSFETWQRFLGLNRGGVGGWELPPSFNFAGISSYNCAVLGLVLYFLAPGSTKNLGGSWYTMDGEHIGEVNGIHVLWLRPPRDRSWSSVWGGGKGVMEIDLVPVITYIRVDVVYT